MKKLIRKLLNTLEIDLTKNLEYDRLTKEIIKKTIQKNSVCIDVGAHKGEILDLFLKYAPNAKHFAFEPIPYLFENLHKKYSISCFIFPYALTDMGGAKNLFNW